MDTLDKRMAQMLDRIGPDNLRFHRTLQSGVLFVSGIFHLIFLNGYLTQAIETMERTNEEKGRLRKDRLTF